MSDLANAPDDDVVFTSRPPGVGGAANETGTSLVSRSSYFQVLNLMYSLPHLMERVSTKRLKNGFSSSCP